MLTRWPQIMFCSRRGDYITNEVLLSGDLHPRLLNSFADIVKHSLHAPCNEICNPIKQTNNNRRILNKLHKNLNPFEIVENAS